MKVVRCGESCDARVPSLCLLQHRQGHSGGAKASLQSGGCSGGGGSRRWDLPTGSGWLPVLGMAQTHPCLQWNKAWVGKVG